MKFEDLDLNDDVLDALYDMRFDNCTPIQEKCIPEILSGRDVLGVAQTGTGKTAAYLLPILSKLADGGYPDDKINCVIMSPTRELAQQIDQAMQGFAYYLDGVSSVAVYGGNDGNRYDQELKSLQLGADVVIATPGRFISHISLGNVDLSKVSFFILDEADRMLDMGFSEDIMTIAKHLPPTCQTIMFSATMPKKIEDLAKTLLHDPVEVKLAVSKPAEKIHQMAYVCHETQKLGIIKHLFKDNNLKRVIIFCGSKMKVKQVAGALQRMKINCGEMHSDLEQAERDDMMFKFKSGQYDVIVATDIIARGIDIDDIQMVVNYDVPHDAEDYVHRIGRTARAERDGSAITLVSDDDMVYFNQIEKFLEKEVEKLPLPEGLGEAPEYRKSSAKSRRRKDRDRQSHKDKKERNNDRPRSQRRPKGQGNSATQQAADNGQNKPNGNDRQENKPKDNQRRGQQKRNDRRNDRAENENPADTQRNNDGAKRGRNQKRNDNPNNDNRRKGKNQDRNAATDNGGDNSRNGRKNRTANNDSRNANGKNSRNGNGEKNRGGEKNRKGRNGRRNSSKDSQSQFHSTKYDIRDEFEIPEKKESGLKKLIKKPFKWLHIIGRK